MPGAALPHLPNDWKEKLEKPLVEECKVFLKDENDIGFIESLKLKLNFKDDACFKALPKHFYTTLQ